MDHRKFGQSAQIGLSVFTLCMLHLMTPCPEKANKFLIHPRRWGKLCRWQVVPGASLSNWQVPWRMDGVSAEECHQSLEQLEASAAQIYFSSSFILLSKAGLNKIQIIEKLPQNLSLTTLSSRCLTHSGYIKVNFLYLLKVTHISIFQWQIFSSFHATGLCLPFGVRPIVSIMILFYF